GSRPLARQRDARVQELDRRRGRPRRAPEVLTHYGAGCADARLLVCSERRTLAIRSQTAAPSAPMNPIGPASETTPNTIAAQPIHFGRAPLRSTESPSDPLKTITPGGGGGD